MRAVHRSRFVLGLLLGLVACTARAVTLEQIPTPRPAGWAVDMTGTLPPERLAELNHLGDQVKETTGAEMAVVVVGSTDGIDAHEFATRLFNTWGIGERGKENGLLVFAALADHKTEIVLGRGLDGEAARRESELVMQTEMVPRFRAGNPAGAIVLGAIACARRILHVSPISAGVEGLEIVPETPEPAVSYSPQPEPIPDSSAQTSFQVPDDPPEHGRGLTIGIVIVSLGLILLVGRVAFRGYPQAQDGQMGTEDTSWTDNSSSLDRYTRSRERARAREEEPDYTSSSSVASVGLFSSGDSSSRSSSSSSNSSSSSGSDSSSNSGSSSGFSGGSSSGGGASGSW